MKLADLAQKQKRLLTLSAVAENIDTPEETRIDLVNTLRTYSNLLARCWESQEISAGSLASISNIERKLKTLHDESRLTGKS